MPLIHLLYKACSPKILSPNIKISVETLASLIALKFSLKTKCYVKALPEHFYIMFYS